MRYGNREIDDAKIGPEVQNYTIGGMGRAHTGTKVHLISVRYSEVTDPAPWEPKKIIRNSHPICQWEQGYGGGCRGAMTTHLPQDYTRSLTPADIEKITCKNCRAAIEERPRLREALGLPPA